MRIKALTTPANLALTLSEAKRQLRIEESETAHDADITALVRAATEWIFSTCHITLLSTDYEICFPSFPSTNQFKIPAYPIQNIEVVEYVDEVGNPGSIAFQADLIQVPSSIYPMPGEQWPETQAERINAVRIELQAGYGTTSASVPEMIKHLIRLLVAHWFRNREAVLIGVASKEIELAADNLMKQIRVNEFESFTP